MTEDEAVQICKEKFQLSSLSKDSSVSPLQMSDCCERLSKQDNPDLNNSTLIVSKYYHVNEDGHISIPWNWKQNDNCCGKSCENELKKTGKQLYRGEASSVEKVCSCSLALVINLPQSQALLFLLANSTAVLCDVV